MTADGPDGAAVAVLEASWRLAFTFEDMLRYSGPHSPGGVALAFKALELVLPQLEPQRPADRREISIETPFGGPGARDGFELVTRALTEGRYTVDASLTRPELGRVRERFVFRFTYRDGTVTLLLRDGYVTEEFIDLAGKENPSEDEDARLEQLKAELAERVMLAFAADVYDVE